MEGLHKDKFKDCKSDLEYVVVKDSILTFRLVDCIKNYLGQFDADLYERLRILANPVI